MAEARSGAADRVYLSLETEGGEVDRWGDEIPLGRLEIWRERERRNLHCWLLEVVVGSLLAVVGFASGS